VNISDKQNYSLPVLRPGSSYWHYHKVT